jgi:hypothetical protein
MGKRGKDNAHTAILIVIVLAVIVVGGGGLAFVMFSSELPRLMSELEEAQTGAQAASLAESLEIHDQAIAAMDPQLCQGIQYAELRDDCYRTLGVSLQDKGLCGMISSHVMKDFCLKNTAQCEGIVNTVEKDACYHDAGIASASGELCGKISDKTVRNGCYQYLSESTGDASFCMLVSDYLMSACLAQVAADAGDASVCENAENGYDRDVCIFNYAIRASEGSSCGLIQNGTIREACMGETA